MTDDVIASLVEEVGSEIDLGENGVAAIASTLTGTTLTILRTANRGARGALLYEEDSVVSDERIFQVALYAMRDVGRVRRDQDDKTSIAKYVGYIGFWFCKLKPINTVYRPRPTGGTDDSEIYDINERVALVLMDRLLLRLVAADPENEPTIWRRCDVAACLLAEGLRGLCFFEKNGAFFSHLDGRYRDYLIYTLRYRAGGPYMLVSHLEQAIYFSCEHTNPPLFSGLDPVQADH